ncbi:MAG: hypothetical protein GTN86_08305 [Xanthomonadales bacterium]|nr:hypothetical protein [Xanthomonadales bacterium]NIN59869.1 hypothetical protein [Xanthomonadales bacterium]NIN75243.1 hypothetical protein [Xanthomonadales bacterium]NIO13485.1 hypothetical protein [Xanthomonadales bacterium]NIP12262.1 hypothetical protein [Xanthomonadales bacterium]
MKRILSHLTCLALLAAMTLPSALLAQEDEASQPPLASAWVMHPKEGQFAAMYAAALEHVKFRKQQGDSRSWMAFQPVIGDRIDKLAFRFCCFDWADQDAYAAEDLEKGLGDHWNATVDQYVADYEHYMVALDYENSHWNDEAGPWTYFAVTEFYLSPGKSAAFNAVKKEFMELASRHNWADGQRYWSWATRIGGKPMASIATPHKNFADMAPPEQNFYQFLVEKEGQEATDKLYARLFETFKGTRYTIWRHIEELSVTSE